MNYDPFARGLHPVGVCTVRVSHESLADRPAAVELWYPAQRSCLGRDLDDRTRDRFTIAPGFPRRLRLFAWSSESPGWRASQHGCQHAVLIGGGSL